MNNPANADWIEYGTEILPKGVLERTGITIAKNEYLTVRSSNNNVSAVCWGVTVGDTDLTVSTSITANSDTSIPVWTGSTSFSVFDGFDNSVQLTATDPGELTYTVTSGTLPTGIALNNRTGLISGYIPPTSYGSSSTTTPTITVSDGTNSVPRVFTITKRYRDGSTAEQSAPNAAYIKTLTGTTTNGFYWLDPYPDRLAPIRVYCDMNYSGGGWAMVLANVRTGAGVNTPNGIGKLTYADVRAGNNTVGTVDTSLAFRTFVGLDYWVGLGLNIAQFCSNSIVTLNTTGSHAKRYRWRYTGFNGNYAFQGATGVSDETATGAPGMLTYHATNNRGISTYDRDQDENAGSCSDSFGQTPFWYGACWDGSFWGGGSSTSGYLDAPYWSGSGGDNYNYMALYLKV